ncbi:MAG TPA: HIRAN domain-containing protein [Verrucomicrobiota bacterium]|nr:HIRAN domain-containing protein [Verrucomicrobiota bacterium]
MKSVTGSRRVFLGFLGRLSLLPATLLSARTTAAGPGHGLRRILINDFAIAGFRYYDGAKELPRLAAGAKLTLRAEPSNPYDSFAVEVFHGQVKLGYVPRFWNRHISRLLLGAVPVACEVEQVDPNAAPWEAVAVNVYLAVPDTDSIADREN